MEFTALQENVHQALMDTQRSVSSRPSLPILSCILIQVTDQEVTFSATDLSIGVRSTLLAKSIHPGVIAVPAKTFADFIATLDPGEIHFTLSELTLTIAAKGAVARIQCMQATDYPLFPEKEGQEFSFPAEVFQEIIQKTSFAASVDEARPILTAVQFSFGQNVEVAATDGFRLAVLTLPLDEKQTTLSTLLMPAKALNEVQRIITRKQAVKAVFTVSETLKQIFFSFEGIEVLVRLMEGDFPPYQKIIPPSFSTQVTFSAADFGQKIKTAMIFARDSSGIIRLRLGKETVTVLSASSVSGTQESVLPAHSIQGEEIEIAFNAKYLQDFLQIVKPEHIWLGVNESLKPALFRPVGEDKFTYIIMPFRVNQ